MKTLVMTLALLGLPLAAAAQVTKEDLKKLTAAGISDDVILSYVKSNGGVARLSADDVIELKQAGASEKLLTSVMSGVQPAPAPAPAPAEREYATQPRTTVVYNNSTPYYYTPSTTYASYDYDYYPSTYYYGTYYPRYYPTYYSSYCYPRYYSSYPRYYSSSYCGPSFSFGYSSHHYSSPRTHIGVGVSVRRR